MDTNEIFLQSELALAAYAKNLVAGEPPDSLALQDQGNGMSKKQADNFAENWLVLDQFNDDSSGLSATIFQQVVDGNPTGPKYLAIRGTEPEANDLTTDGLLALGLPASLNPQFTALKAQLDNVWLAAGGPLHGETFTVTGHSLGGYLAAAVKEQYGSQVTDAYLYNAPGVAGLIGGLFDLFGLAGTPSANVWNLTASEGASIISGLGAPVGTPINIQIEAAPGAGFGNHSIVKLTDPDVANDNEWRMAA